MRTRAWLALLLGTLMLSSAMPRSLALPQLVPLGLGLSGLAKGSIAVGIGVAVGYAVTTLTGFYRQAVNFFSHIGKTLTGFFSPPARSHAPNLRHGALRQDHQDSLSWGKARLVQQAEGWKIRRKGRNIEIRRLPNEKWVLGREEKTDVPRQIQIDKITDDVNVKHHMSFNKDGSIKHYDVTVQAFDKKESMWKKWKLGIRP